MTTKDHAVRAAAQKLQTAIAEAEAAGYRVTWPGNALGLGAIAVSETAAVAPPPPAAVASKTPAAKGRATADK